ncbi:ABC transporter permease [Alicyclobacillus kakegawensis]|uniref:ABC transporter permease n=1 Tax=Alicyclobacillus kakegawensis TaxID=392012 RepID=UPI00082D0484|nr:ABC transporter permease [Alicyclobacillus kakegawensis]
MRLNRILRTAFLGLGHNPLRTALTLLGIIIGVAAVVALLGVGQAATASVTSQIQGLGTNVLVISPGQSTENGFSQGLGSSASLTDSDVKALQKDNALAAVAGDVTTRAQVVYGSVNYQTQVEGTTPDIQTIRNLSLAAGRFFNTVEANHDGYVAVIGPTAAENLFGTQSPVGKTIWIDGLAFEVVGELASEGSSGATNNDDRILIPLQTMQAHLLGGDSLTTIYASARDSQSMTQAQLQVEATLRQAHGLRFGESDDFTVTNQATLLSALSNVSHTLQVFLGGIAGISLLVGGIGIMNIMLVTVSERTREIGLRKSLGATQGSILGQFLTESAVVGLLGGCIGIVVGIVGAQGIGRFLQTSVPISPSSVWISFVVAVAVGLVFGVYPALRAARMSPMNALRYE